MTDRELLEYAAKAAAIGPLSWIEPDGTKIVTNVRWNPLTDDGDAFRLAVKLEMDFVWDFDRIEVYYGTEKNYVVEYFYELPTPTDRCAATRRAIVKAAAEIGKGMV